MEIEIFGDHITHYICLIRYFGFTFSVIRHRSITLAVEFVSWISLLKNHQIYPLINVFIVSQSRYTFFVLFSSLVQEHSPNSLNCTIVMKITVNRKKGPFQCNWLSCFLEIFICGPSKVMLSHYISPDNNTSEFPFCIPSCLGYLQWDIYYILVFQVFFIEKEPWNGTTGQE